MRRASDMKPSSTGAGRGQAKPARPAQGAEAFGRFVRNLARLEGRPGAARKDKEGGR
jgi:hypothetical protein